MVLNKLSENHASLKQNYPTSAASTVDNKENKKEIKPTNWTAGALAAVALTAGVMFYPKETAQILKMGWDKITSDELLPMINQLDDDHVLKEIVLVCRCIKAQIDLTLFLDKQLQDYKIKLNHAFIKLEDLNKNSSRISLSDLNKNLDCIQADIEEKKQMIQEIEQKTLKMEPTSTLNKIIQSRSNEFLNEMLQNFQITEMNQKITELTVARKKISKMIKASKKELERLEELSTLLTDLTMKRTMNGNSEVSEKITCSSQTTGLDGLENAHLLTPEEFKTLPNEGDIDPTLLRWAQPSCSSTFSNSNRKVSKLTENLIKDPSLSSKPLDKVHIGVHENRVYCFNTRRLVAYMNAWKHFEHTGKENPVKIPYQKASETELKRYVKIIFEQKPGNGIMIAFRYGKKNSESTLIINPRFEDHMRDCITGLHEPYPQNRNNSHDPNGFQIKKGKINKAFEHLKEISNNIDHPNHWLGVRIMTYIGKVFNSEGKVTARKTFVKLMETYQKSPHKRKPH